MACFAAPMALSAQTGPQVERHSGAIVVSVTTPDGVVRAYFPDDVRPGERFAGSIAGPAGYSVRMGAQRANAGDVFRWSAPEGSAGDPLAVVFAGRGGVDVGSALLQPVTDVLQEPAIKVPPLVQAGRPFAIRGPFDGDPATTKVTVGGVELPLLAESPRKAVVRASGATLGAVTFSVRERRVNARGTLRGLAIEYTAATDGTPGRDLKVSGLAGLDRDVPIDIAGTHFYLDGSNVPADGVFTQRRRFSGDGPPPEALLVIPQTRREEVLTVLRTPRRDASETQPAQHARALRALDFEAMPIVTELLTDDRIGSEAANAMLQLDERAAMRLIFDSMPKSGLSVQRIGFIWFLEHQDSLAGGADAAGHAAAVRVLGRIPSTTLGELALYTVGLTGSNDDFPLLQRFARSSALGAEGLRSASETALARLGSRPHLESIRAELQEPFPPDARYRQGLRMAQLLRKAGLTGSVELVPVICGHIADPVVTEIDLTVDPGRSAGNALSLILESASPVAPRPTGRRSQDEWRAYCSAQPAAGSRQ